MSQGSENLTLPGEILGSVRSLPPLARLLDRAASNRQRIAFAEGEDPRIVAGALAAVEADAADVLLVGKTEAVQAQLASFGATENQHISIHDPASSPLSEPLAQLFTDLRQHKGMTIERARDAVQQPLFFAALLLRAGHADGTVGGAVATTSDTVRAALQVIGKAPEAKLVSSFFLMCPPQGHSIGQEAMVFSDCGMVIAPDAAELASIAQQAAQSFKSLADAEPKVAMLSFSTKGSASHEAVTKVSEATEILRTQAPALAVDGELQLDAALVPSVAASKAPGSPLEGAANVLIFPSLEAGNIAYKTAQRFGGVTAIGPVLQGLSAPANDLSRGCTAEDVLAIIAVTAVQALDRGRE